jgi:hypothetical protein
VAYVLLAISAPFALLVIPLLFLIAGLGTRFRATARSGRRVVKMLIEVTECYRARRFGSRATMPSVDISGGLTFAPVDGATRMSWFWRVRPSGPLRLLGPLVARPWAASRGKDLDRAQEPPGGVWPGRRPNRVVIKDLLDDLH